MHFDVISLFDAGSFIRDGIGMFAPQYGPRLGFFLGASKKF